MTMGGRVDVSDVIGSDSCGSQNSRSFPSDNQNPPARATLVSATVLLPPLDDTLDAIPAPRDNEKEA